MALEIHIKKKLGAFTLNVDYTFDDHCLGILGASGCGKSLMLKCIAGIETPDEGYMSLDGQVLFDSKKKINLPPQKRQIGYLFQNYALFPNMTVLQNICVGIESKDRSEKQAIAGTYIKKFQLEGLEGHYPFQLSGGQQQRVALARMLAAKPAMILLDEPFSALDAHLKDTMHREMLDIINDYEGKVLIVSHSRDEIYKLCPKLSVMHQGQIFYIKKTGDVFENPEYIQAARLTGCKNISTIEKIDDYHVRALDWQMNLETRQIVTDQDTHVGVRAYHIEAAQDEKDTNTFRMSLIETIEAPFEVSHLLKYKSDPDAEPLWWKTSKSKIGHVEDDAMEFLIHIDPKDVMPMKEF